MKYEFAAGLERQFALLERNLQFYLCLGTGIRKDLEIEGAVISQPPGCFQLCSVLSSLRKPSTPFLSRSKHS